MTRYTVMAGKLYVNGDYAPVASRTVRMALWLQSQKSGQPLPGPGEHEISSQLAAAILEAERTLAVDLLGQALLRRESA